jgi:2-C-methyl-D-erythritol 4-phosphate cytidylyltransferase
MGKVVGIILMGGVGVRFGSNVPKQFHSLKGKKIYLHTLEAFLQSQLFDSLVLVCHPDWVAQVKEETARYSVVVTAGGKTRQQSSYLGLLACPKDTNYVVIHDALRPFVSQEILERNVTEVKVTQAVDTCIPSSDTIVYSRDGYKIDKIPLRKEYFRGQTPQSFAYLLILQAHQTTSQTNASDDCSLVLELGHAVTLVLGEDKNIKITTEFDLHLASANIAYPIEHRCVDILEPS